MIRFEDIGHRYFWGARELPSVSAICAAAGVTHYEDIPATVLALAAARGKAVHRALRLAFEDDLDADSLDPLLAPYVAAGRRFVADSGFVPLVIEQPYADPDRRFAGTPDAAGPLRGAAQWTLIDWKCVATIQDDGGVRTAAYQHLLLRAGYPVTGDRLLVQLRPDGTYRVHRQTDPRDHQRWQRMVWDYHQRQEVPA